jgi:flavodoxin
MKMKVKYFVYGLVSISLFFLFGCQSPKKSDSQMETSNRNSDTTPSTITATNNYGRGATSDGADTNAEEEPIRILTENTKSIIIYFSRSGNTENLAKQIKSYTDADMLELQVKDPYPEDYKKTVDRATSERESENYPELATEIPDLSQYDTVFLGHPIWGMTIANPIARFLEDNRQLLNGKSIASFSTNAGYGAGNTLNRIAELSPESTLLENYTIEDKDVINTQDKVEDWVINLGLLKEE